ncbi:MAG: hypothetical protein AAGB48_03935 [Planctomycetota bacterium]
MARKLVCMTVALLCGSVCLLGGCAALQAESGRFAVDAGGYARAFETTRTTLNDLGWTLDRVDAGAGVITTLPRPSSLVHADSTSLRIEFVPAESFGRLPPDTARTQIDLGETVPSKPLVERQLIGTVTALRVRTYRPIFRPQVADVIRSGRALDPLLLAEEPERELRVPIAREPEREAETAGAIAAALRRATKP